MCFLNPQLTKLKHNDIKQSHTECLSHGLTLYGMPMISFVARFLYKVSGLCAEENNSKGKEHENWYLPNPPKVTLDFRKLNVEAIMVQCHAFDNSCIPSLPQMSLPINRRCIYQVATYLQLVQCNGHQNRPITVQHVPVVNRLPLCMNGG